MLGQMDRLLGVVGMDTVRLGIVPFSAALRLPPADAFWVVGEQLVIPEDRHAELWLDDSDTVALYRRVWESPHECAVFGAEGQHVIARAGQAGVA
ncbi:Scr1 family TA system antitoxin-like transcriptional regulator [Streptomyces sp. NPDC048142]|uniref:Scr1 family TA system antitoxin-like transcriptional regulator n=1 Tax=Streptomyces sp. NPDC048142 TaxID=3365501 RepID=UPI003717D9A6